MTTLQDPISKFKEFIDNDDNNSYRTIRKLTPKEAGLNEDSLKKLLLKFKKNPKKPKETKKIQESIVQTDIPKLDNTEDNIDYRKYGKVLSYTETRKLFKNINELRRKHYLEDRHSKIMDWYYDNRYQVNILFKETMLYMIEEDFEFLIPNKALYNNFVEYCYDSYMKYHI